MHSIRYTRVANEKFMTQLSLIKKLTIKEDHSLFVISTNQIKELIMWSGVYDIIRQAHLLSRGGVSSTQSSSSPTSKTTLLILVTTPANNLGVRRKGRVQRGRLHWIFARWSIHSYPNTMLMVYTLEQDALSISKIIKRVSKLQFCHKIWMCLCVSFAVGKFCQVACVKIPFQPTV